MEALQKALEQLTRNERYLPLVRDFSEELHDIFEAILVEALIQNPSKEGAAALDGAAILAICMKCFKNISKTNPDIPIIPQMRTLPSQRYQNASNSRTTPTN